MRGEQRARSALLGDVFHRRPGDGKAVERRRPPPHLVQYEQTALRGEFEDVRHLTHLDHERGSSAVEIVRGADARKNAIRKGDIRRSGGHETAHVGHQRDQRHLAHVGGFAGHVRAGDDHHAMFLVQMGIVGHEQGAPQPLFDHRMPAIDNVVAPISVDRGAHVLIFLRYARKRKQRIQRFQSARRGVQARKRLFQRLADLAEELIFKAHGVFFRTKDLALEFLEFLRDETLAVGQRLFARIAIRHELVKRARDFDIVAKHAVIADLQILDARGFPLALFHFREVGLAIVGDIAQFIQLTGITGADHAAFAHGQRRLIVDSARKQRTDILHWIQRGLAALNEFGLAGGGVFFDQRHKLQCGAQRKTVAGIERVIGDAAQEALDIVDAAERLAQRVGLEKAAGKAFHGVQARVDFVRVAERAFDPAAQEPSAHRRLRAVEYAQKRSPLAVSVCRLRQFKALQGGAVQRHETRALIGAQLQNVRERVFLRFHQIGEQRAGRADTKALIFKAEFRNPLAKMFLQTFGGVRILKRRRIGRARTFGALRNAGGQGRPVVYDDLARFDARQLVGQ